MSRRVYGEREKELQKLSKALKRPRTMTDLVYLMGVDRRTVYRYLDDLRVKGLNVARVGLGRPTKYKIS